MLSDVLEDIILDIDNLVCYALRRDYFKPTTNCENSDYTILPE